MKKSDVELGMRVIPFRKTAIGYEGLSLSFHWQKAKSIGQKFLYVIGWDKEEQSWQPSHKKNTKPCCGGDFFRSGDFYLYEEE